jgi:hypothetical protein
MSQSILEEPAGNSPNLLSLRGVALAGTFATISAAFLVCRVPNASPRTLSALALLLLSMKYLSITMAVGVAATWLYFTNSVRTPLRGDPRRNKNAP